MKFHELYESIMFSEAKFNIRKELGALFLSNFKKLKKQYKLKDIHTANWDDLTVQPIYGLLDMIDGYDKSDISTALKRLLDGKTAKALISMTPEDRKSMYDFMNSDEKASDRMVKKQFEEVYGKGAFKKSMDAIDAGEPVGTPKKRKSKNDEFDWYDGPDDCHPQYDDPYKGPPSYCKDMGYR